MQIETVFRSKRNTAMALRKNMVAAITVGGRIILAVVRRVVAVKEMGITSDKCFLASREHPVTNAISRALESGMDVNECDVYITQWSLPESWIDTCICNGIKRIYYARGTPSERAIRKLCERGMKATRFRV